MNVIDKYKGHMIEDIKSDLILDRGDFTSVFMNVTKDFNKSVGVRNHNAFGGKDIWFVGRRAWDRRGAVGTYHYEDIHYAANWNEFIANIPDGPLVCVENNAFDRKTYTVGMFKFPKNSIFVYGEEGCGIPDDILDMSEFIVTIPMWGCVRSLNVSVSSGIIMYEYRRQHSLSGLNLSYA